MEDTLLKRIGRGSLMVLGACFLLGAVIYPFIPAAEYVRQRITLETEGVHTTAKIVDKYKALEDADSQNRSRRSAGRSSGVGAVIRLARETDRVVGEISNPRNLTEVYYVKYKFATQAAKPVNTEFKVSPVVYDRIKVGSEASVVYHPANPEVSRLPAYSEPVVDNGPGATIFMSVLMAFTGLWLLGYGWRLSQGVAPSTVTETAADREIARLVQARKKAAQVPAARSAATQTSERRKQGFGQRARA